MIKYVPILGPEGWVESGEKKLDRVMAHLYASDASQTHLFRNHVSSMSKVIKDNQGRLDEAKLEIKRMLSIYLSCYFENVEVNVYIYETDDFHKGELVLSAVMLDETGKEHQLHEVMTKEGSLVRQFLNYQYENQT